LTKPRIFLAYCSNQVEVANAAKKKLQKDFDIVLWQETKWGGGILLDQLIDEIKSCDYGVAILSCDDRLQTEKHGAQWVPRDNVTLEVGMFLSEFGQERTALVRLANAQGELPRFPTDLQGWLRIEINNKTDNDSIHHACEQIKHRFSQTKEGLIPSLNGRRKQRSFNVLSMLDIREQWGAFEGILLALNPCWSREQKDKEWLELHAYRYQNPEFLEAHYVIDIDRGQDRSTVERSSTTQTRLTDPERDLLGMLRFINLLRNTYPDVEPHLENKLKIYIVPGARTEMTTFISEFEGWDRGFIFVRRLNESTVLEARAPEHVRRLREQVTGFIAHRKFVRPSEIEGLCSLMVHR
jgi:Predicted nucleotide-binding protein containing TIR-like domain